MTKGLTLIGILFAIAAGMILVVGTSLLATRSFGISREQTEQVRITEDARVQMERMSDAIRDARSIDLNGDSQATFPLEIWLQHGGDFDIQFYTNFDTDEDLERLHYFLEGTELKLGVKDPYTSGEAERVTVVARSLRNIDEAKPLFQYYAGGSEVPMGTPVDSMSSVERVRITLVVDVDVTQYPPAAVIETIVRPRAAMVLAAVPPAPTPTPTPAPAPTPAPTPAPAPAPPVARLTVNGQDDATAVAPDAQANLAWTSTNATACTAAGDWAGSKPVNGSETTAALGNRFSLRFSGGNERVRIDSPGLPTGNFTYSVWVNPAQNNGVAVLSARSNFRGDEFAIFLNSKKAEVYFNNSKVVTSKRTIPVNRWTHLVVTRTTTGLSVYIDGSLDRTISLSGTLSFAACSLLLGTDADSRCEDGLGNYLAGNVDELKIFNRSLPAAEIAQLFRGERQPTTGLILHVPFDEGSGTVARDSVGGKVGTLHNMEADDWQATNKAPLSPSYGYQLQCTGPGGSAQDSVAVNVIATQPPLADLLANNSDGPVTIAGGQTANLSWESFGTNACTAAGDWAGSKPVNGSEATAALGNRFSLAFDGVNEYVSVPDNAVWTLAGDFTLALWVNFTAIDAAGEWWRAAFMAHNEGAGAFDKWILSYDGDANRQLVFHMNRQDKRCNAEIRSSTWTPSLNQWYNIVLTKSGSVYTFYRDGTSVGTVSNTCAITDATAPLRIAWAEGAATKAFNGRIDDVHSWSRALSGTEIQGYLAGTSDVSAGQELHLRFDDGAGTSVSDSSGKNRSGTLLNMESSDWDSVQKAPLQQPYAYKLQCQGTTGVADDAVSVVATTKPSVTLTVGGKGQQSGECWYPGNVCLNPLVELRWTSAGMATCGASGNWSGAKATAGYEYRISSPGTYTLACTGATGGATSSATVTRCPGTANCTSGSPSCPYAGQPDPENNAFWENGFCLNFSWEFCQDGYYCTSYAPARCSADPSCS